MGQEKGSQCGSHYSIPVRQTIPVRIHTVVMETETRELEED